jgi:hypothetical protein
VLASSSACRVGNRAHSIYDFAALSAYVPPLDNDCFCLQPSNSSANSRRTSDDQHHKNPKLKSRLSLNVGTLASAREPAKKKRPSFQALLSGRSQSGPPEHLQSARLRADSAQSSKSIYSASTLSSAGSRLLRCLLAFLTLDNIYFLLIRWLGIGGEVNGRRPPTSSRKSPSKKCKRRQSAL